MAVRPILLFPDDRLKRVCPDAVDLTGSVRDVLVDLGDTLDASPGVGLAAPQMGVLLRAIVVDIGRAPPRKGKPAPPHHGRILLVNPRVVKTEGKMTFREGCLSVPDFLADIERARFVQVMGWGPDGNEVTIETQDFEAIALQHEIDHLEGTLFLDRVANIATDLIPRKKP